jgi:peptidyl-prolyl cis-trans isomerase D
MMNIFRRGGAGQWIVAVIAGLIIVVFVVEFRTARGPGSGSVEAACAVEMKGVCLDRKDFYAAYGLVVPSGLSAKQIKALSIPDQVLEGLIERELLVAEAERLGLGVGDQDLERELMEGRAHVSLPAEVAPILGMRLGLCVPEQHGQSCAAGARTVRILPVKSAKQGTFDPKIYERVIRNVTNRGAKQFRDMQEREVLAARVRDLVRQRVRISPEEAFLAYRQRAERTVVKYVALSREWFARLVVDSSPAAVEKWTAEHTGEVDDALKESRARFVAKCPLVSEIVFRFPENATDEEKTQVRGLADAALARLKNREPFEQVARQVSEGEQASEGGSLGCFTDSYGTGYAELVEVTKKLAVGESSPVVESPRGFHLLRLDGELAEGDVDKVARQMTARRLAVRFLADQELTKYVDALIAQGQKGTDLAEANQTLLAALLPKAADGTEPLAQSDARRPKLVLSEPFGIDGSPGEDFSPFAGIGQRLVGTPVGQIYPKPLDTIGGVAVLSVVSRTEASREEFEKNGAALTAGMREEKAYDALVDYVARLRKTTGSIKKDAGLVNLKVRGSDE